MNLIASEVIAKNIFKQNQNSGCQDVTVQDTPVINIEAKVRDESSHHNLSL